ncbi:MAG: hypothetical protein ACRD5F_02735, partial [Candidatus Acidiferrales bacterium]
MSQVKSKKLKVKTQTARVSSVLPFPFSFLLLPFVFLCPSPAHAQITFDAGSNGHGANVSSVTFSHSCSGSNRILFVGVYVLQSGGAPAASTVTYAGVSLTLLNRIVNGNHGSELWYLVAPPTGANDVVVTIGVSTLRIWPVAVSFTGAH